MHNKFAERIVKFHAADFPIMHNWSVEVALFRCPCRARKRKSVQAELPDLLTLR